MDGYESPGFCVMHFLRNPVGYRYPVMVVDETFDGESCETHVLVGLCPLRFQFFYKSIQKMSGFLFSLRIEGADSVTHTGHILMAQLSCFHAYAVQCSRHDHEGSVAALRRLVAEVFAEVQHFPKCSPSGHIHYSLIIYRSFRCKAVRTIVLQFMGQVAAGHKYHPSVQILHRSFYDHSQSVMLRERQAR